MIPASGGTTPAAERGSHAVMQATVTPTAAPVPDARNQRRLAQGSWTLYDFANTIFSYAIVSTAIGLWLTADDRFGQGLGQLVQGIAIAVSVGLNALVSPILGAMSDRAGRRLPFLLFFTVLTIVPSAIIGPSPAVLGAILFTIANFGYQAALIYYDATLTMVSRPETRGQAVGARRRDRVLRHDLRCPHADPPRDHRIPGPDLPRRRHPVRRLRDPDLPRRPRPPGHRDRTRREDERDAPADPGQGDHRPRADGAGPGGASSSAGSSTATR